MELLRGFRKSKFDFVTFTHHLLFVFVMFYSAYFHYFDIITTVQAGIPFW